MNLKEQISKFIEQERTESLKLSGDGWARLAIIQIGKYSASDLYIKSKKEEASKWNINCDIYRIDGHDLKNDSKQILNLIKYLNMDSGVSGIIVQLPIPFCDKTTQQILDSIAPEKNVDGFAQSHDGEFSHFYPCTPLGIINFLKWKYSTSLVPNVFEDKNIVVIGRGKTVGDPLVKMLLHEPYNKLTVCASHTNHKNLEEILADADIIISAVPIPEFIDSRNLKESAIVIDAGIAMRSMGDKLIQVGNLSHQYLDEYKIDFTPWTNGVGKLTVAMLMSNVHKAYRESKSTKLVVHSWGEEPSNVGL